MFMAANIPLTQTFLDECVSELRERRELTPTWWPEQLPGLAFSGNSFVFASFLGLDIPFGASLFFWTLLLITSWFCRVPAVFCVYGYDSFQVDTAMPQRLSCDAFNYFALGYCAMDYFLSSVYYKVFLLPSRRGSMFSRSPLAELGDGTIVRPFALPDSLC
jgi:hypothetical protein